MGLDQYLEVRKFISTNSLHAAIHDDLVDKVGLHKRDIPHSTYAYINLEVMYWRKANQIHNWFVQNVQNGEDDCQAYQVSTEKLQELRDLCEEVLRREDTDFSQDKLPVAAGFFFGSTDYDEWYYGALEETVEALDKLLMNPSFKDLNFYYSSSW